MAALKVVHWSMLNGSGMNRAASSITEAEKALGIDSRLCNSMEPNLSLLDDVLDADIHVSHTHIQDAMRRRLAPKAKIVWVGHGTPEHVFQTSVEEGGKGAYGHADGLMLCMNWLRTADACVTFWPRHQAIWQSLCDKGRRVHCIPLGVDTSFWKPVPTRGKFSGTPSLLSCENCHYIKWPLDLFIAWPWVYSKLATDAKLHVNYLPNDMHRWFFPLVNRNGCSYASYLSPIAFGPSDLRNAFCSVDYFIGLVRYGDFNVLSLQAAASGVKTISYSGNPYSDFWIPEGDQRVMADEMLKILNGEIKPREKSPVPSILDTANGMIGLYNSIL